jgi:hypothetical protein
MCKTDSRDFKGQFPLFSIWWSELTSRDQPHRGEHRLIGSERLRCVNPRFLFPFHFDVLPIMLRCCSTFKRTHPASNQWLPPTTRDGMRHFSGLGLSDPEYFLGTLPEMAHSSPSGSHEVATIAARSRPKVSFTTNFQSVFTSPDSLPFLKQPRDAWRLVAQPRQALPVISWLSVTSDGTVNDISGPPDSISACIMIFNVHKSSSPNLQVRPGTFYWFCHHRPHSPH